MVVALEVLVKTLALALHDIKLESEELLVLTVLIEPNKTTNFGDDANVLESVCHESVSLSRRRCIRVKLLQRTLVAILVR